MLNKFNKIILRELFDEHDELMDRLQKEADAIRVVRDKKNRDEDSVRYDNFTLTIQNVEQLIEKLKEEISLYKSMENV